MHDDRVGRLAREFGAAECARLQALAGVAQRVLIRPLGQADALQAHAQACGIHHRKHRLQAFVRLADQVALRAFKIHHAGHRGLDAHLVLDGAAMQRVTLAHVAIAIDLEFGGDEQRDALGAGRCVRQLGQHQVHDVVGEVVLAGSDEDLGAGDGVAAIGIGFGAGLEQAQVGAAMRLGQAHGAGPAAVDQRREEDVLLPGFAVLAQRFHRAMRQQREGTPG